MKFFSKKKIYGKRIDENRDLKRYERIQYIEI